MKKDTKQIVCIAEFLAKENKIDELVAALHSLIEPTHAEKGCLRYELNQREDDARWITFVEKWEDRRAFDEHCATPYIRRYFDQVRPDLVEKYEVKIYREILP